MTKLFTTSLMALALGFSAQAYADDVKAFSFSVEKEAVGKEIAINISAVDGGTVFVDWGNGTKEEYTVADYDGAGWVFTQLTGTLGSNDVIVYTAEGVKINYVDLSWDKDDDELARLTSLKIDNLPDVKELYLENNHLEALDVTPCTSLATLNAYDNRLTTLTVGEANSKLSSVNVSNNYNVTTGEPNATAGTNSVLYSDWNLLPALKTLNATANQAKVGETLNLSKNPNLATLTINCCGLETLDASALTGLKTLNAQWNQFETLDLSNMIALKGILTLNNNKLTEIKLPDTADKFTRINISGNCFTFATLPSLDVASTLTYAPQADVVAEVKENVVDLSEFAKVGDTATVYTWKSGEEEVTEGFTAADGVFTFNTNGTYVCSMTNEAYPALTLNTTPVTISDAAAVEVIEASDAPVEYFNLQGVKVSGTEPGIYVRRQGNNVSKVIVK